MSEAEFFIFPFQFSDILVPTNDNSFRVNSKSTVEKQEPRTIKLHLDNISKVLLLLLEIKDIFIYEIFKECLKIYKIL
jgi:hypothetical protein